MNMTTQPTTTTPTTHKGAAVQRYLVTRRFTAGLLVGLTHTAWTSVRFTVGQTGRRRGAGSPYIITSVVAA